MSAVIEPDLRGKHSNRPHAISTIGNPIKEHIATFPTVESHYRRAASQKKYLFKSRLKYSKNASILFGLG